MAGHKAIFAAELTTFAVADDGTSFRLSFKDELGAERALILPSTALKCLFMSLFKIADTALKRQWRDDSMRLVYPVSDYKVEIASGSDRLILTLETSDEFAASFAVRPEDLIGIAVSVHDYLDRGLFPCPALN